MRNNYFGIYEYLQLNTTYSSNRMASRLSISDSWYSFLAVTSIVRKIVLALAEIHYRRTAYCPLFYF